MNFTVHPYDMLRDISPLNSVAEGVPPVSYIIRTSVLFTSTLPWTSCEWFKIKTSSTYSQKMMIFLACEYRGRVILQNLDILVLF